MITTLLQATIDFSAQANASNLPGSGQNMADLIGRFLSGAMVVAVLLVLLYLVWGGIGWVASGGDSAKVQKARDRMTQAVIGLIILASVVAILALVQNFLRINVLRFERSHSPAVSTSINEGRKTINK